MLRVLPAQQRFDTEHLAAAHVHLRLVVQRELVRVERVLHAADGLEVLLGAAIVLGVEEQVSVAAGLLGAVHRVVGVAQQRVGVGLVDGVHGGADARGDGHRPARYAQLLISQAELEQHREAVEARVENFKRQARIRARRWGCDPHDRHRRYRRHVAKLEASLASQKRQVGPRDQRVLDYAFEALASEA